MAYVFSKAARKLNQGAIDIDTNKFKATLLTSTGVSNVAEKNTSSTYASFTGAGNIVQKAAANVTPIVVVIPAGTIDVANDEVEWRSTTTLSFTNLDTGQKVQGVLVFKSSGNTTTSPVVILNDFTEGVLTTAAGSTVQVTFTGEGPIKTKQSGADL